MGDRIEQAREAVRPGEEIVVACGDESVSEVAAGIAASGAVLAVGPWVPAMTFPIRPQGRSTHRTAECCGPWAGYRFAAPGGPK